MADISDGMKVFVEQFRAQADENMKHLGTLNAQFIDLAQQYNDIHGDLECERVARRHAQQRTETLEHRLRELEESTMRSAFVLVLVDADADAYMFNYLGDPSECGKRAAVDLKGAVQQYLKSVDSRLAGLPVVAKAFASGEGLATLLVKAGIATRGDSHQVLSRFTWGFSQADMFDFVLVGTGKDRADHKLMAAFHQFVESPSCQHVLLACCHDSGYVRMLEKCVHNSKLVEKVTLVKSFQTGVEFKGLPFQTTTMDTVFRSNSLGHSVGSTFGTTDLKPDAVAAQVNMPPVTSAPSPPATYASRAAASQQTTLPSILHPRPLPFFGTLAKDVILLNADGHRIDMLLPPKSAPVFEAFIRKTHVGGKRFCNMYHLYGACAGNCTYLHDPLTAGEKLVMRHKLRTEKCNDRGKCRDPLGFYGHHCACSGMGKKCSFPVAMHGVDVSSWREVNTGLGV